MVSIRVGTIMLFAVFSFTFTIYNGESDVAALKSQVTAFTHAVCTSHSCGITNDAIDWILNYSLSTISAFEFNSQHKNRCNQFKSIRPNSRSNYTVIRFSHGKRINPIVRNETGQITNSRSSQGDSAPMIQ